jgi:Ca-activated chloride channel family protein
VKFEYNWAFYLLFILPVIIFLILFEYRKKRAGLKLFADPDLLPVLTMPIKRGIIFLKGLFLVIAVFFIILACAGPRWGFHLQEVQRRGVDIVFLLDVSASMQAEDVKPDRLERAKREITDFLKIAAGDRIGLVLFAGDAFVQCPLTLDYDAIAMFLGSVGVDTLPVQGTDMGQGIKTALNAFDFKSAIDKVIVMITDGEDNEGLGLQQADKAMDKDVKIFVYGIGEPSGAPIPDETGGFKKDKIGNLILSKLNEKDLRRIAKATDGRYVRSVTGDLDLDRLYFEGIKIKTEAKELESGKIKIFEERFYIFIWIAFLFLVMEGLIGLKPGRAKLFSIMAVLIICCGNRVWANENPEELYQQGHYKKAEQAFIKKDMDHPKDVRNRYNRGCASFQNANYEGASAAFRSALKRTDDKQISFSSAYNLGNSLFKQGDFQGAAQAFKQAIKINPGDEDSKYNYGLALKTIEENQKKEKEEEKQQKNQDQNQEQEQEQEQNKAQDKKNKDDRKKDDSHKKHDKNQDQNQDNQKKDSGQDDQARNKQEPGESAEQNGKDNQPGQDAGNIEEYQAGAMNKNEAQAFLDNIGEDPAAINRLRFHGKEQKTTSGKDW